MLRRVEPLARGEVEERLLSERALSLLHAAADASKEVRDGLRRAGASLRGLTG